MKTAKTISAIILLLLGVSDAAWAQDSRDACVDRKIPQLVDVLEKTGIKFSHTYAPEKKSIVESMSGGVLLIDYDRDGWQDIYFTNAPTVEMALKVQRARSMLYRNNKNGTFTDVTDKSGVSDPGFAMGGAVADYNNDGWPDIYVTCLGGDRKSTRLNSSHVVISYDVFCFT